VVSRIHEFEFEIPQTRLVTLFDQPNEVCLGISGLFRLKTQIKFRLITDPGLPDQPLAILAFKSPVLAAISKDYAKLLLS